MTYYRDVWLCCDDCGASWESARTAGEAREMASEEGWTNDGGDDYCPKCSDTDEDKTRKE